MSILEVVYFIHSFVHTSRQDKFKNHQSEDQLLKITLETLTRKCIDSLLVQLSNTLFEQHMTTGTVWLVCTHSCGVECMTFPRGFIFFMVFASKQFVCELTWWQCLCTVCICLQCSFSDHLWTSMVTVFCVLGFCSQWSWACGLYIGSVCFLIVSGGADRETVQKGWSTEGGEEKSSGGDRGKRCLGQAGECCPLSALSPSGFFSLVTQRYRLFPRLYMWAVWGLAHNRLDVQL